MTFSFAQTRGGDFFLLLVGLRSIPKVLSMICFDFLFSRNEKYISTVEEGTPSYYNALMRLQILNVSCKIIMMVLLEQCLLNNMIIREGCPENQ